jgi:ATP-binding cassette, subfamily B, bacterial PglK
VRNYKELMALLCKRHQIQMLILQFFFLITAIFQVGGIASIAPFIAVISNPSVVESNFILAKLYNLLGAESLADFLIGYAAIVTLFILVSNLIASFALWMLFNFSARVGAELQNRLYSKYMSNQYVFFAMNNSANLIANITQQIPRFVYMVLQPTLHLISQSFISIIIVVGLLYINPALAIISISVIGGVYALIYWTVRKRMIYAGEVITEVTKRKLLLLNESIMGIKEVKLSGIESWYGNELDHTTRNGLNASAFAGLAGDIPKFIVETIVFSAILVLAIYLLFTQGTEGGTISSLSFYAMAGYKILPAAQTAYKSISSLQANGQVIGIIQRELNKAEQHCSKSDLLPEPVQSPIQFNKLNIELQDIRFTFPGKETPALDGLNLQIKQHQMIAFVGSSGAGKSTTVDIILGLLKPERGALLIDGVEVTSKNLRGWQSKVGYVPQNIFLLDDSILKNIAFGVPESEINLEKAILAAKKANIHSFIEDLPNGYMTTVGERGGQLSGGQRQRIGIARALYQEPEILILDEATSALDTVTERQILSEIHELAKNTTIIMIAHRLSTIKDSDVIFVFDHGKAVANGKYEELIDSSPEFNEFIHAHERSSATLPTA